jgi:glycosyltransferase involved in cell wall biosynthesis
VKRYKVLLIAEMANPEWASVPLEGWSHSCAIREFVDAHVVTQVRNAAAMDRAGWVEGRDFTALDTERIAKIMWSLSNKLRGGSGVGWTTATAVGIPSYYDFERTLWAQLGKRIQAKEWELVHRLTPLSPTYPSIIAGKCKRAGVPFVIGPLNGGVPWPKGFDTVRRAEKEWLSYVRNAYKLLPGYGATRRDSSAVAIGSIDTWQQFSAAHRHKCVYIPENAIDPVRFPEPSLRPTPTLPLKIAFVGRLVPYKGADMLIEAAAPLARDGKVEVDVFGDGPEMDKLKGMVANEALTERVRLHGWVKHTELHGHLAQADIFGFPSIREFGGAVVLEAMAMGLVPIVVDYGGPAELVTELTGYKATIGPRAHIVESFRSILAKLASDPSGIRDTGLRARERVFKHFTWQAKAAQVFEMYRWVLGDRPDRPDFGMPLPD